MKLLKYENYVVTPTEELFLIKPLRDLYNNDSSKNKEGFMQQISYMYHLVDPRSSYADIIDIEERAAKIIEEQGFSPNYKPSAQLEKAITIYKEITTTTSMRLLNSMRTAIQKISYFLEHVDLFEVDDKGKPMYSISSITAATDKVPQLAKKLQETEKIVASEIEEAGRARGGNETKKLFEDGF